MVRRNVMPINRQTLLERKFAEQIACCRQLGNDKIANGNKTFCS